MSLDHILNKLSLRQREELYEKLNSFYLELSEDFKTIPQPCTQCGACCDFVKFGHKLYISSLEFAYVYENHPLKIRDNPNACPYMVENSCHARNHRMLGCRTFFRLHEKKDEERANELYEIYLQKLKNIYSQANLAWEYKDFMVYVAETLKT